MIVRDVVLLLFYEFYLLQHVMSLALFGYNTFVRVMKNKLSPVVRPPQYAPAPASGDLNSIFQVGDHRKCW